MMNLEGRDRMGGRPEAAGLEVSVELNVVG